MPKSRPPTMSSSLLQEVKQFLKPADSDLYECRHCGKTLEKESEKCPDCGCEDIAQYKL